MTTYNIPQDLLQAAVSLLNEMPAMKSRYVLNAIEQTCQQQDQQRSQEAEQKKVDEAVKAAMASHEA